MAAKTKATSKKTVAKAQAETKKLSQMAAAEKVLTTAKEPMTCKALVEAMAKKKLWASPGGKTPEATLYAALLRHIRDKGTEAKFKKVGPGQFALNRRPPHTRPVGAFLANIRSTDSIAKNPAANNLFPETLTNQCLQFRPPPATTFNRRQQLSQSANGCAETSPVNCRDSPTMPDKLSLGCSS